MGSPSQATRRPDHAADFLHGGDSGSRGKIRSAKETGTAISQKRCSSPQRVKVHMKHMTEKLGASDRTHAMAIDARRGFIRI